MVHKSYWLGLSWFIYESYWVDLSWLILLVGFVIVHEFLLVGFVMLYESYWVDLLWFMNLITAWICRGSWVFLDWFVVVHESYWLMKILISVTSANIEKDMWSTMIKEGKPSEKTTRDNLWKHYMNGTVWQDFPVHLLFLFLFISVVVSTRRDLHAAKPH